MNSPKFYVESDGDRVPKDVYICADDGLGRVATIEAVSENQKFKIARLLVHAANSHDDLLAACKVALDCITPTGDDTKSDRAIIQLEAAIKKAEKGAA
jgi:hypothetical protein